MTGIPFIGKDQVEVSVAKAWDDLPFDLALFHIGAHAEQAFVPWFTFNGAVLGRNTLDRLLMELAIIRTGLLCGAEYEWGHHVSGAMAQGATEAQIEALKAGNITADVFDDAQQRVLKFTTEVVENVRAADDTLAAMAELFNPRQIVEFIFVIAMYMMNSRIAENGGVTLADDAQFNPRAGSD